MSSGPEVPVGLAELHRQAGCSENGPECPGSIEVVDAGRAVQAAPAGVLPTYRAIKAERSITVDGVIDDEAWTHAPWTGDFIDIRGEEWPAPRLRTRAKLVWDYRALYIAAELEEPHLWATLTDHDDIVWRDDDFEVFLDPDGDGLNYFEIEINPAGTVLDLFLARPYNQGGSAVIDWNLLGLESAVVVDGTLNDPSDLDRGWSVEFAIPWSGLVPPGESGTSASLRPRVGDEWRVNFSRVDWPLLVRDGRYVKERELLDWNDHPEDNWVWAPQGEINMHLPDMWGVLRFDSGPEVREPSRPDPFPGSTPGSTVARATRPEQNKGNRDAEWAGGGGTC